MADFIELLGKFPETGAPAKIGVRFSDITCFGRSEGLVMLGTKFEYDSMWPEKRGTIQIECTKADADEFITNVARQALVTGRRHVQISANDFVFPDAVCLYRHAEITQVKHLILHLEGGAKLQVSGEFITRALSQINTTRTSVSPATIG